MANQARLQQGGSKEADAGALAQISIFVLPLVVLIGWIIHKPFYLNFDPFATMVLTLSVIHAYFVSSDGNSNWCDSATSHVTVLYGVLQGSHTCQCGCLWLGSAATKSRNVSN